MILSLICFKHTVRYDMVDKGIFLNSFDLVFQSPIEIKLVSRKLRDFADIRLIHILLFLELFFSQKVSLKKRLSFDDSLKSGLIFFFYLRNKKLFDFFDKLQLLYNNLQSLRIKPICINPISFSFLLRGFFSLKRFPSVFWGWDPHLEILVFGSAQIIKLVFSSFNIILDKTEN